MKIQNVPDPAAALRMIRTRMAAGMFLVALVVPLTSASPVFPAERVARVNEVRRHGGGELRMVEGTPFLILQGTPHEMGLQYGTLLRNRVRETLDGAMDRIRPHLRGMPRRQRERLIRAFEASMPEPYRAQIRGVSEGAGVPYPDLLMGQYFDEILRLRGCSSILAKTPGGLLHARNMDYLSDLFGRAGVVVDYRPTKGTRSVVVGFIGDCGALAGMNEHGITVSVNTAPGGGALGAKTSMPAHYILRAVLDSARTIDAANGIVNDNAGGDGSIVMVGSGTESDGAVYDLAGGEVRRTEFRDSRVLFATNDYLHRDLNSPAALRMCERFAFIESRTHARPPVDVDDLISILADPGETSGVNNPSTIQSVVLDPQGRSVYVSFAPSYAGWGLFLRYDLATGVAMVYREPDTERIREAEADIHEIHVLGAYWNGDARIPREARRPGADFILFIRERFEPEEMDDYSRFVENAGSEFVLRTLDRPDVRARLADPHAVSGKGSFCGVWLTVIPEDRGKFVRGIPYSVHPAGQGGRYRWTFESGVMVTKPGALSDFIRSLAGAVGL